MGPRAEFPMTHGAPTAAPGNATAPHSPWQSPVPYLFGGLAAMMGLIAFALLILACSYWKLSGYLDAGSGADRDQQAGADGEKGSAAGADRPAAGFQEHVVVIMAGDERPTFLATPAASRAAAEMELGAASGVCSGGSGGEEKKQVENDGGCADVSSPRRLGADAGDASRSHERSSSSGSSTTAPQESSQ